MYLEKHKCEKQMAAYLKEFENHAIEIKRLNGTKSRDDESN